MAILEGNKSLSLNFFNTIFQLFQEGLASTLNFIYIEYFYKEFKVNWQLFTRIIEPVYEISNNVVCATSKASDQPAHTRSLIRAFASRLSIL